MPFVFAAALISCEGARPVNGREEIGQVIQCDAGVPCDGLVGLLEVTEMQPGGTQVKRVRLCTAFLDEQSRIVSARSCLPEELSPGDFPAEIRATYHSPQGGPSARAHRLSSWDALGNASAGPFDTRLVSFQGSDAPRASGFAYASSGASVGANSASVLGVISWKDERGAWRHRIAKQTGCQRQSESAAFPFSAGAQYAAMVFSNCGVLEGFLGAPLLNGDGAVTGVVQGVINPEVIRTHLAQRFPSMISWNSRFVREMIWASSTPCWGDSSPCRNNPLIRELLLFPEGGIYFPSEEWQKFARLMETRLIDAAGFSHIRWVFEVDRREDSSGKIGFEIIPVPHCYLNSKAQVPARWRGDLPVLRTRYDLSANYQPLPGSHSETVGSFDLNVVNSDASSSAMGIVWSVILNDLTTRTWNLSLPLCGSNDVDARFSIPWQSLGRRDQEGLLALRSAWNRILSSRKNLLKVVHH